MSVFTPYVSLRDIRSNNLGFVNPPQMSPTNALTRGTNLLLLIHGFNNTVDAASSSYTGWFALQNQLGGVATMNVVGVYWPGSNWENFAVYMQAIAKAEDAASRLAAVLRKAADDFGVLRVRIVTHSLGSRLTLEMLHELRKHPHPRLFVERFVVMAAAVPIHFLTPGRPLRDSLDQTAAPFRNLYSPKDKVLSLAFRLGESLRGEGFWPVALGHEAWTGSKAVPSPRLTQEHIAGASHGDYWAQRRETAVSAREFLNLGSVPRTLPTQTLVPRDVELPRSTAPARGTPTR